MRIGSCLCKVYEQPIFRKFKAETTLGKVMAVAIIICSGVAAILPLTCTDLPSAQRMLIGIGMGCIPTSAIIYHYFPTGKQYGHQQDDYFEFYA